MKFGIALTGMALTLFGATAAQAQLTITLTSPIADANNPGYTEYFGTVTNSNNNSITVDGDNIGGPNGVPATITFVDTLAGNTPGGAGNPNNAILPGVASQGTTYTFDPNAGAPFNRPLFELNVPAGTPLTDLTFSLSDAAGMTLGSADFTVGTSNVPEPGSVALLASSLVGGSLLMARCRRK